MFVSLSSKSSNFSFTIAALLTACLLLFHVANDADGLVIDVDEIKPELGRRLRSRKSPRNRLGRTAINPIKSGIDDNIKRIDDDLRYLAFGGPSTYGRGLDGEKRTSEAYPYLLSSAVATTSPELVRNVAQPHYETGGLTFASLCTQSVVVGKRTNNRLPKKDFELVINEDPDSPSWSSSSIAYDVITLEYAPDTTNTAAALAAYKSSFKLLTRRLRKRYPLASITIVELWSPLDLVSYDPVANRTVSFLEWRSDEKQKEHKGKHLLKNKKEQPLSVDTIKKLVWTFRDLSPAEQEHIYELENTMATEEGTISRMPRPKNINDSLDIITDWFIEEEIENENDASSSLHYTLSQRGHAQVAKGIRDILELSAAARITRRRPPARTRSHPSAAHLTLPTSSQLLVGSWGSGDSCQLWYETGRDDLPDPHDYTEGLKAKEFHPGRYALEVVSPNGGNLTVHNPFDEDRIVYLTYLTTSARAAANKVYPKTKVSVVKEQNQASSSSTIVLDPSHDNNSDLMQRTRTTAVGLVEARTTGMLELSPLEAHTIHHFRILGVSFLTNEKMSHDVPFEFAMSPRGLLIEGSDDKIADIDDFDIEDEHQSTL